MVTGAEIIQGGVRVLSLKTQNQQGQKDIYPYGRTEVVEVPTDAEVRPETLREQVKPFIPLITMLVGMLLSFITDTLGYEELPYTSTQIVEGIGLILSVVGGLWSWYKNNDVSTEARKRTNISEQVIPKRK